MNSLVLTFTLLLLLGSGFASEKIISPFILDLKKLMAFKSSELQNGNSDLGKRLFKSRRLNCLSCHEAPIPEERFHGNFGPSMIGVGSKYSKAEIRIRIIEILLC